MPTNWQNKFIELINEIPEYLDLEYEGYNNLDKYDVRTKDEYNKFIADPIKNYERGRRRLKIKN